MQETHNFWLIYPSFTTKRGYFRLRTLLNIGWEPVKHMIVAIADIIPLFIIFLNPYLKKILCFYIHFENNIVCVIFNFNNISSVVFIFFFCLFVVVFQSFMLLLVLLFIFLFPLIKLSPVALEWGLEVYKSSKQVM